MAVTQAYSFADLFAFTRATAGWNFDAAGALVEAAAGSVRADYDPATLAWRGWLIEQAAMNSLPNPRAEGAAAGTPGTVPTGWVGQSSVSGMTREVVGVGAEGGIPYIDIRWSGTPAGAVTRDFDLMPTTSAAALAGQVWTAAPYLRMVGGTTTGVTLTLFLHERSAAGATTGNTNSAVTAGVGTSSLSAYRPQITRTFTGGTTAFANVLLRFSFANAVPIDITLRIGAPQLWQSSIGLSPSLPPIGTPGASTRNADDLSMTSIARWFNATAGTFVMDFMPGQSATPADRDLLMIDDGTSANRLRLRMLPGDTTVRLGVTNGGVGSAALNSASGAELVRHTARFSYGPAGHFLSVNGAAPVSHADAVPGGLTRVLVGNSGGANYLNGWIGPRLDYFPTQYTDTAAADGYTIRTR